MNVVVLGATGQIGSTICNGLQNKHAVAGTSRKEVTGLVQFDPYRDNWAILGTPDVLINCVGQIVPEKGSSFYAAHNGITTRILENRDQLGNPRIIQISALGASVNHPVDFLNTKGIADDLLLQHSNTVVIRPSIVCTPGTMIVRKMLMISRIAKVLSGVVPVPKGFPHSKVQPVMPRDLVDLVHMLCESNVEGIISIGGPEVLTLREIIMLMARTINLRMRLMEIPRMFTDPIIGKIMSALFPRLISSAQYDLLFDDNVTDIRVAEALLGRRLTSTRSFFEKEFSYAAH